MKKALILVFSVIFLLLCGCGAEPASQDGYVDAVIVGSPRAVCAENLVSVKRGEDAVFTLRAAEGFFLTETDYPGEAVIEQSGSEIRLTLKDVRYPARVQLKMVSDKFAISYEPVGCEGTAFTEFQENKRHKRPNTANATAPFFRPQSTLIAWNTEPDGTGTDVGLGSRITVGDEGLTLYPQWADWTDASYFEYQLNPDGSVGITACDYGGQRLVIPGELDRMPVTLLKAGAFAGCRAETVIFPPTLKVVENGAFEDAAVRELYLFDSIDVISDKCFPRGALQTLHINAFEKPSGAAMWRESCYPDKVDMLILSQDRNRIVFYGGCSMWYNLNMPDVFRTVGEDWFPVDMGLNGTFNSEVQLQIMLPYLHSGDIFFHTPEISSDQQMMRVTHMSKKEDRFWSGLEYNYDLLTAVDFRGIDGVLDSLCYYLGTKKESTSYADYFKDSRGKVYCGPNGEVPFERYENINPYLGDVVRMGPNCIPEESRQRLGEWYARLQERGVRVFVSFACINADALPPEERQTFNDVDAIFRGAIGEMPGVVLLSEFNRFRFTSSEFYDSNYHLLSGPARYCTEQWMKALAPYLDEMRNST